MDRPNPATAYSRSYWANDRSNLDSERVIAFYSDVFSRRLFARVPIFNVSTSNVFLGSKVGELKIEYDWGEIRGKTFMNRRILKFNVSRKTKFAV